MRYVLAMLAALLLTGCMVEPTPADGEVDGPTVYLDRCESCHGWDGRGSDAGPDLYWRIDGMTVDEVADVVLFGDGLMDAVDLDEQEAAAVAGFVVDELLAR